VINSVETNEKLLKYMNIIVFIFVIIFFEIFMIKLSKLLDQLIIIVKYLKINMINNCKHPKFFQFYNNLNRICYK
jgi:hypothetical protein